MDVNRFVKMAFVVSVFLYAVVAVALLGAPAWKAPWVPSEGPVAAMLMVVVPLAVVLWGLGWSVGRMKRPPGGTSGQGDSGAAPAWPRTRFVLAAALVEAGALLGLAAAFVGKDSRYAVAFAVPTAIVLYLLPTELHGDSPPGQGPPPIG